MIEVSHRFATFPSALQRLGNRTVRPKIVVCVCGTLIFVFNYTWTIRITATIKRNLFRVQSHCVFATALP